MEHSPSLLFLVNVDWFFLSHRLPVALAAKQAGYDVTVAAADTGKGKAIEAHGLKFFHIPFSRKGTRLINELALIPRIFRLYRRLKPDLVHHVSIKPVIYGSLVSRLFPKVAVVNAITGMGFVFSGDEKAGRLRHLVKAAYRLALGKKRMRVIFQNEGDRDAFVQNKLINKEKTELIRGSGVDCELFQPRLKEKQPGQSLSSGHSLPPAQMHTPGKSTPPSQPIILLASRMIRDKGIAEFVEAAALVRDQLPDARFVLAGMVDYENPNTIQADQLREWEKQGHVEWWGHREDMVDVISQASIVALPTYYPEGVPKILIEAAASGKPIVTTNRPGCSDIVKDGVNGILVPQRDSKALATAILELLNNPEKMDTMGKAGRQRVLNAFDVRIVTKQTLALYKDILTSPV